jgi:hypothetical protein
MTRWLLLPGACAIAACFALPSAPVQPIAMQSPAATQAQARASVARSMGYPTRKSPDELEAMIQRQTKRFRPGKQGEDLLDSPSPFAIEGVRGTCYTIVIRLGEGAAWDVGAEAGLRFDFRSPSGPGSGGPGVVGPGAIASVGCAEATGPIAMTMAPLAGNPADPIGHGRFTYVVWSHVLTPAEAAHLEADKQQQIAEQRDFAAREAAKEHARVSSGCSKCEARYQGCLGAGRSASSCRSSWSSCAFEEAGPSWPSVCPNP